MSTVFEALSAVTQDLSAKGIGKNQTNTFDKYKFRGIDDVLNVVGPILAKHGVVIIPSIHRHETNQTRTSQDKPTMHSIVVVNYEIIGPAGDRISGSAIGEGMDRGDKSLNKAMTSAYKNFVFEALCIPVQGHDSESESHEVSEPYTVEQLAHFKMLVASEDGWGILSLSKSVPPETLDGLFNSAPKGEKVKLKEKCRALAGKANTHRVAALTAIHEALLAGSITAIDEVYAELPEIAVDIVNSGLTEIELMQIENLRNAV